jgi:GTPase SAR1 family protein
MSKAILILGQSGSGKSTSIESLNSKETFIIQPFNKDLPFKGWKSNYPLYDKAAKTGNRFVTTSADTSVKLMNHISANMPEIKTIIVDDLQYWMASEFMEKAKEKGFEKFNSMALNFYSILKTSGELREDLTIILLCHTEDNIIDGEKSTTIKTLGKMIDSKITAEGMFTIVLYTHITKTEKGVNYNFRTNTNGNDTCKSPKGMFEYLIPNDLQYVLNKIKEYEN